MNLTKETLKQIIKEELDAVMNEEGPHDDLLIPDREIRQDASDIGGSPAQINDLEAANAQKTLRRKQYTFPNAYDQDPLGPTLYYKDEAGKLFLVNNTCADDTRTERFILFNLKPKGYEGIGIIGPNSHLR